MFPLLAKESCSSCCRTINILLWKFKPSLLPWCHAAGNPYHVDTLDLQFLLQKFSRACIANVDFMYYHFNGNFPVFEEKSLHFLHQVKITRECVSHNMITCGHHIFTLKCFPISQALLWKSDDSPLCVSHRQSCLQSTFTLSRLVSIVVFQMKILDNTVLQSYLIHRLLTSTSGIEDELVDKFRSILSRESSDCVDDVISGQLKKFVVIIKTSWYFPTKYKGHGAIEGKRWQWIRGDCSHAYLCTWPQLLVRVITKHVIFGQGTTY